MTEVAFNASFAVSCEKKLIFGKIFPYWKIPGTEYPTITEKECLTALECPDRPNLGAELVDSFDNINYEVEDTFQYYCDLGGARGLEGDLLLSN